MKTNTGQLNLVTLTRAALCSGLDEIPTAKVEEWGEEISDRIYKWFFSSTGVGTTAARRNRVEAWDIWEADEFPDFRFLRMRNSKLCW